MTRAYLSSGLLVATLLTGGCATKKYVQTTTAPIQAKVDQVGDQTNKNGQQIQRREGTGHDGPEQRARRHDQGH